LKSSLYKKLPKRYL